MFSFPLAVACSVLLACFLPIQVSYWRPFNLKEHVALMAAQSISQRKSRQVQWDNLPYQIESVWAYFSSSSLTCNLVYRYACRSITVKMIEKSKKSWTLFPSVFKNPPWLFHTYPSWCSAPSPTTSAGTAGPARSTGRSGWGRGRARWVPAGSGSSGPCPEAPWDSFERDVLEI